MIGLKIPFFSCFRYLFLCALRCCCTPLGIEIPNPHVSTYNLSRISQPEKSTLTEQLDINLMVISLLQGYLYQYIHIFKDGYVILKISIWIYFFSAYGGKKAFFCYFCHGWRQLPAFSQAMECFSVQPGLLIDQGSEINWLYIFFFSDSEIQNNFLEIQ